MASNTPEFMKGTFNIYTSDYSIVSKNMGESSRTKVILGYEQNWMNPFRPWG